MTSSPFTIEVSQQELQQLAGKLSVMARQGDVLCLSGDLGAGKTTFARFFIEALLEKGSETEIPSPSFALVQNYNAPRFDISHFDFYRLNDPFEVLELGLDEAINSSVSLIEWPEKAETYIPENHLQILFEEVEDPDKRNLTLTGYGNWKKKLERFQIISNFLEKANWSEAEQKFLQGDASPRAYTRLKQQTGNKAILMDAPKQPDGPPIRDGKPYSAIAHLAEDVSAFVAVGNYLKQSGVYSPEIYAQDLEQGLLLIEDLGDGVFGKKIANGEEIFPLYQKAVDVLLSLRKAKKTQGLQYSESKTHHLHHYDIGAMTMEIELVPDWYWLAKKKQAITEDAKQNFVNLWQEHFKWLEGQPKRIVLRDFHSPNLIWCPDGQGIKNVAVIDFQDAVYGHAAYDLVSLLQDARLDVSQDIEKELFEYYCAKCEAEQEFKKEDFSKAYALLGAQRNTKILGIFARLALRDGKHGYLAHIPRIWDYLERNLAHPSLSEIQAWYDVNFPKEVRQVPLEQDDLAGINDTKSN